MEACSSSVGIAANVQNNQGIEGHTIWKLTLLDKTGTITHGNREAVAFVAVGGHSEQELAEAAVAMNTGTQPAGGCQYH